MPKLFPNLLRVPKLRRPRHLYVVHYKVKNANGNELEAVMCLHEKSACRAVFYIVKSAEKLRDCLPGCSLEVVDIKRPDGTAVDFQRTKEDHLLLGHLRCPA